MHHTIQDVLYGVINTEDCISLGLLLTLTLTKSAEIDRPYSCLANTQVPLAYLVPDRLLTNSEDSAPTPS